MGNDRPERTIREGMVRKGGQNTKSSQVRDRPPSPAPLRQAERTSSGPADEVATSMPPAAKASQPAGPEARSQTTDRERCAPTAVFVLDKVIALVQSDMPKQNALAW